MFSHLSCLDSSDGRAPNTLEHSVSGSARTYIPLMKKILHFSSLYILFTMQKHKGDFNNSEVISVEMFL